MLVLESFSTSTASTTEGKTADLDLEASDDEGNLSECGAQSSFQDQKLRHI